MKRVYYVYILLCENNNYYTGYTTDLQRRYQEHVQGSAKCKYTRSFPPIRIAQSWEIADDKNLALKTERFIKNLSKAQKQKLIRSPAGLMALFNNTLQLV